MVARSKLDPTPPCRAASRDNCFGARLAGGEQVFGDDQALDLASALADLTQLYVAEVTLHWVFAHVAVAA